MTAEGQPAGRGPLRIDASRGFAAWLAEQQVSLAFTTYQAGKLFLVGLKPGGQLSIFERTFDRAMGLCAAGDTLWLSSAYQLWRFENVLAPGQWERGFDRLYVPRVGHTTGDLDVHDVALGSDGNVVFVSTLFSCLATLSDRASFRPLWRPPFVSRLAAEDRCHLNGLATDRGEPRYVTCVSRSDVADGWRERRRDGGCVLEVATGEAVVEGLSMPHSPRLHEGRLWLLDSGNGFLGRVDLESGRFDPVLFCPGYARGLAFFGNHAVVGMSRPREGTFQGLALSENLEARGAAARCGLLVVDLSVGEIAHWLRLDGPVEELYDVAVLPGAVRPTALGFKSDEIRYTVTAEGDSRIWRAQGKRSSPKPP